MAKIIVFSLDFDGCLFHDNGYFGSKSRNRLIDENQLIIEEILQLIENQKPDEVIFMVGSNRQSYEVDVRNATKGGGSCFNALHKFCEAINNKQNNAACRVNKYLLADTYNDKKSGDSFDKAMYSGPNYNHAKWLFDDSKLTILYAQMHKIASENPKAEITYNFFEDRCFEDDSEDILCGLRDFFLENSDLIPKNITLSLHKYNGKTYKVIKNIKGRGSVDYNHEDNLLLMVKCAKLDPSKHSNQYNNIRGVLTEHGGLKEFKKLRDTGKRIDRTITNSPLTMINRKKNKKNASNDATNKTSIKNIQK